MLCKFCGIEFDYEDSHISTRLKEHFNKSERHNKLKKDFFIRQKNGQQLTIEETKVRLKRREENAETVCHDFVYSLSLASL